MLTELLFCGSVRPSRRALLLTAGIIVASFAAKPSALSVDGMKLEDGHAVVSLDLALAAAYCGRPSSFAAPVRIAQWLAANMDARTQPLRDIIVARAGSVDAFCAQIDTPFVNSENSLMKIETAVLRLAPGSSLSGLAQVLYWLRIACLAAFVFFLLVAGSSIALAFATFLCGVMLLQSMPDQVYSTYPFFFCLVLLAAAWHGLAVARPWMTRGPSRLVFAAGAGLLAAFVGNMRTSYLPIVAAMFGCVLIHAWRSMQPPARLRLFAIAGMSVAFAAAFVAMQAGVITRGLPADRYNAQHPFGHPLILALAVPENALSRELDIKWEDAAGPRVAARVDPGAPFLGPRYDRALMTFYRSLWRDHTRAMIETYVLKFSVAGEDMINVLRSSPGVAGLAVSILLAPLALLPNGIWLLALMIAIAAASFRAYLKTNSPAAFALALLSLAACLLQVEAGVIFSVFVKQYHNYLAFYVLFISLLAIQRAADFLRPA